MKPERRSERPPVWHAIQEIDMQNDSTIPNTTSEYPQNAPGSSESDDRFDQALGDIDNTSSALESTTGARLHNDRLAELEAHYATYSRPGWSRTAPPQMREYISLRDDQQCQYCGDLATETDHIIPWNEGGRTVPANLVASCHRCNAIAGSRLFSDINEKRDYIRAKRYRQNRGLKRF
jgi:hypothetical protein